MRASPTLFCTLFILAASAAAQTAPPPQPPPQKSESVPSSGITLSTGTQLVVLDVTVQDHSGQPIRGLKLSDFQIEENKKPQTIKTFEEHTAADLTHAKFPAMPKLPPGTFTNYTPVPPSGTLNILLLDTLNTPMKDQAYVRYQLQQYVKHAEPGTNIAIFGLTSRLIFLQSFSSDPEVLKNVVEHKLIPRASVLLDDPTGSNTDPNLLSDALADAGATASVVAGMQQFEAQNATFQAQLRIRYTLDAFNQLARYLATFPGRKNLIWFSGAFPLTIFPDSSLDDPFAATNDASGDIKETTALLDRARVAVYPIDARGLQPVPVFDASRSGANYARNPQRMSRDISNFTTTNTQEHMAMDQIAEDTGGHAFYNTNGLADAVTKSIAAGSNFYTVTYTPTNREPHGEYRKIKIQVQGALAARGLNLSYRHGYYAQDPKDRHPSSSLLETVAASAPATGTLAYAHAAMQRGAPTPSEILFKVRVLPDSTTTEDAVAPHNHPNPNIPLKGPFRRYDVDMAALTADIALPPQADGSRHGAIEFLTYVYDADGRLLNLDGHTVSMNLTPDIYAKLMKSGIAFHLEVSAPAKSESFLRIAIHDITSGHMGVVEVPTSTLAHLPPPPHEPAPAPAGPAPTPAQPSTPPTPSTSSTPSTSTTPK